MPGSSTDKHGDDPVDRQISDERGNTDLPDLLHELILDYVYRTQADLERVDRRVQAQAEVLADQQRKLQELVSRIALLAASVVTEGGQAISTKHQEAVVEKPAARSGCSGNNADSDFLRNWFHTFRPVGEEQFKLELHHCRVELDHDIKAAVKKLREEVEGTLASCMEVSAQAEVIARSSKQETLGFVVRAKIEALRQSITCLEAVHDEDMRSSLISKLLAQEDQQKRMLSDLGYKNHELGRGDAALTSDPLLIPHAETSESSNQPKTRYFAGAVPFAGTKAQGVLTSFMPHRRGAPFTPDRQVKQQSTHQS